MSENQLPLLPVSEQDNPLLPAAFFQQPYAIHHIPRPQLSESDSVLFQAGFFSRTLLDTIPPTVQLRCLQPDCLYTPKPQLLSFKQTSNYWTHYHHSHPEVSTTIRNTGLSQGQRSSSSHASDITTLFTPRVPKLVAGNDNKKYRELLLDFIVSNNLALRLVDQRSFRQLVHYLNPSIITISTSTLNRDLEKQFLSARSSLKLELQEHIKTGGRISITTDAWSARNYKEFIAVTGHWINKSWKQRSQLLDIVQLKDPIHSGEYLAEQLLSVTDDFNITEYIFTVTRDNARPNDVMLDTLEAVADQQRSEKPDNLQQPWSFTRKEGDVRCIGHIINIAVQAALASLKAIPADEPETYRMAYHSAQLPVNCNRADVVSVLAKLRRHIYIFRNRRLWRIALENQCKAVGISYHKLPLDMPVRWNSTFNMIKIACSLQAPITAVCATQEFDLSVKQLMLSATDWLLLNSLLKLFIIFVHPSKKLQGNIYPTMNYAIPQYLRLLNKLQLLQAAWGGKSPLGLACAAAYNKLDEYYTTARKQNYAIVATVCDPRFNFNVFQNLWPDSSSDGRRLQVRKQFIETFIQYEHREQALSAAEIEAEFSSNDEGTDTIDIDSESELFKPRGVVEFESEWSKWMKQQPVKRDIDILRYWTSKEYEFPIISRMAKDHLAIPATSAASESVFSVGGDIITKKRNRLGADNTRRLLCMRDWGISKEEVGVDSDDEIELDIWE